MNIEYTATNYFDRKDEIISDPIDYWVEKNLERDGIEKKLDKIIGILAVVTKGHLIKNPEDVDSIAYILECDGRNHKII